MKLRALLATLLLSGVAHAQPPQLEVQAVASTGSMPKGVSLSPDSSKMYVTNFGQHNGHNIDVLDAKTLAHLDTINVPGNVVESVLSKDGSTIYASNFLRNSVMFLDTKTKQVTREIQTGAHPKILALSHDQTQLFAANWSGDSVTQIDIASAKVVRTLVAGKNPRGMAITADGTLFAAELQRRLDRHLERRELHGQTSHHRVPHSPSPRARGGREAALRELLPRLDDPTPST